MVAPLVGLVLGLVNGVIITSLRMHSFLATLATSLVFRGIAILITGGLLIPVRIPEFTWLGRGRIGAGLRRRHRAHHLRRDADGPSQPHNLRPARLRRRRQRGGGDPVGRPRRRVKIVTFALTGVAAGLAAAIAVSRISMGQPTAGIGMELEAIAAVILGGTTIYGGEGRGLALGRRRHPAGADQQRVQHPQRRTRSTRTSPPG